MSSAFKSKKKKPRTSKLSATSSPTSKNIAESAPRSRPAVVVTGIGTLCPLGNGPATLSDALFTGRSGLIRTQIGEQTLYAGRVTTDFPNISARQQKRLDRFSLLALQAAVDAVADARLSDPLRKSSGVFLGSGFGGLHTLLSQAQVMAERGPRRVSPFLVPAAIANAATAHIAEQFHIHGPTLTYTSACASGAMAIGEALLRLHCGDIDLALAGGSEAALHPLAVAGFANARAFAPHGHRNAPFSTTRAGFNLAEGATVLVLERAEHAHDRKARIYAELAGYGTSADAHHITEPDPEGKGAERAVRRALAMADIHPAHIDYINAHATGTHGGDQAEARMLARVFDRHQPWVSSTKGSTGHLLGAAGALESAICALTVQSGLLPANLPDPVAAKECPVKLVDQPGKQQPLNYVLNNSFGFGGVNVALVFRRPELGE